MTDTLTLDERIQWLELNKPDLYTALQNWRCVEDDDSAIPVWLDENGVPR